MLTGLMKKTAYKKIAVFSARMTLNNVFRPIFWPYSKKHVNFNDIHQFKVFFVFLNPLSIDYADIIIYHFFFFRIVDIFPQSLFS